VSLFFATLAFVDAPSAVAVAGQQSSPAAAPVHAQPSEIVVTGKQAKQEEVVATGSRLKPAEPLVDYRGFVSQVATSTGVAGLTPQSGMDPFAGPTITRTVRSCRSSDKRLSQAAVCELAKAKAAIAKDDLTSAKQRLRRVLEGQVSNNADRFIAQRFQYELALKEADKEQQFEALSGMVQSNLLPQTDQVRALKTLASLALQDGENAVAISLLERVIRTAPSETKAYANLGALYAGAGAHDLAKARLLEAVRLTKLANLQVPQEWTAYLRGR
jgi:hypothetical protein